MPYIIGFLSGLIVTGLVLTNLDSELIRPTIATDGGRYGSDRGWILFDGL